MVSRSLEERLSDELARVLTGTDVDDVVTLRAVYDTVGGDHLARVAAVRKLNKPGLPMLVVRRGRDTVAMVPWDLLVKHFDAYWRAVSTREKREPGKRSEPQQRADHWQKVAAGSRRHLLRLGKERDELRNIVERLQVERPAKGRDLETQEALLAYAELRAAALDYFASLRDRAPGSAAARTDALRRMHKALGGE